MSERDDYLFDPKAPVDETVAALERALRPLAWRGAPMGSPSSREAPSRRRLPWLFAAAALLLGSLALWFATRGGALVPFGPARTFVAAAEPVRVSLGDLAEITLRPGSELTFQHWRKDEVLFALRRGALEAKVAPPPKVQAGFFRIETALGLVIDQGCRYELVVHDDGRANVRVTEGAVTFATPERTVFVPAGAVAEVTSVGASTPVFLGGNAELAKAVREFDMLRSKGAPMELRGESLKMVLAAARAPRDSLVLWHLLRDPEPDIRAIAEQHLVDLVGPPDGGKTKRDSFDAEEWLAFLRLAAWHAGG